MTPIMRILVGGVATALLLVSVIAHGQDAPASTAPAASKAAPASPKTKAPAPKQQLHAQAEGKGQSGAQASPSSGQGQAETVPGAGPRTPPYAIQVQRGIRLILAHDLDGAVAAFRKAIEMNPQLPQAHYFLGAALRAKGDLQNAVESFETAARMAQGDANWQARGWTGAAMTLEIIAAKHPELPTGDQLTPETPRINEPGLEQARDAWNHVKQAGAAGAQIVDPRIADARIAAIDRLEQTEKQTVAVREAIAAREKQKAEEAAKAKHPHTHGHTHTH